MNTHGARFPLGLKLALIISILILFSLGVITFLVSWMVSGDVQLTAETNNFNVNKRSASETEIFLNMIRSNSFVLLDTMEALESLSGSERTARQAVEFFFERNRDIAFIGVTDGDSFSSMFYNEGFFTAAETDATLALDFAVSRPDALGRCRAGELLLLNAAPALGVPALAMFCPWQKDGALEGAVIIFSADALSENFGTGTNVSYLVNDDGDILIHADYTLVRDGVNAADDPFVKTLWESGDQNFQTLYSSAGGQRYFGAFQKLSVANAAVVTNVEYRMVFEGIAATTKRNIFLTGAVLFLSILFIYFFSKTISRPLRDLSAAAERIERGEFELSLKAKTRDEVGALTESFGRMTQALEVFGRFTNREIAIGAMRGEIKPGGLSKHATIFFSDIRSFTAISEGFTEQYGEEASAKIVEWLNEYLSHMVECIEKTDGVVDKYIGDSVMAHWGTAYTSGSPKGDALNCVKTALAMRKVLHDLNRSRSENSPKIRIGCGINTGIVTAGQIGSERRMEYTVIGDPVNLASRTEALNKPFGTDILITENTHKLIGEYVITEEMPPVKVKGKEKSVRVFAVINLKAKDREQPKPSTLAEVRQILGIPAPDLTAVDTGEEEKKYHIGEK